MENTKRVFDDRTNETLFKGSAFECMQFINYNFDDDSEEFPHIWISDKTEGLDD